VVVGLDFICLFVCCLFCFVIGCCDWFCFILWFSVNSVDCLCLFSCYGCLFCFMV